MILIGALLSLCCTPAKGTGLSVTPVSLKKAERSQEELAVVAPFALRLGGGPFTSAT
jgi:hypothetical protein